MDWSVLDPAIIGTAFVALALVAVGAAALRWRGGRHRDVQRMVTLLCAKDPTTRIQALERAQKLEASSRAALARALRSDLSTSARGGKQSPQQPVAVWFIRQVLACLCDSRPSVRTDAARVLAAVMIADSSALTRGKDGPVSLVPAITAAIELAGGQILAQSRKSQSETRVLALAEMLEAGLRPLAVSLKAMQGVQEEAMEPLSSALRDRSPRVRRSLVEVLAAMGGERAVEMLKPLLQDPSPDLRAEAANALGKLDAKSAADQIVSLLDDPVSNVRAAAAFALAAMEWEGAAGEMIEALGAESRRTDAGGAAQSAMIAAIVRLSNGALPELAQALKTLPRPVARRLALALEDAGTIEAWLRAEWHGREDILATLLASISERGVSAPLLDALDSTEEWVRTQSAAALGYSRDPAALTAVTALLNDPEASVRAEAVRSIAKHADPPALQPLAQATADPDDTVRLAAVAGMNAVLNNRREWNPKTLPTEFDIDATLAAAQHALLRTARDTDHVVRRETAVALGAFDSAEAADTLVELALTDDEESVRDTSGTALGLCNFAQKRRLLAGALEDESDVRRARATALLAAVSGNEAGRQLVEALDDRSEEVRRAALKALATVPISHLGDALIAHLRNPDAHIRAGVAMRIGESRHLGAVEALIGALADPDENVRMNALHGLAHMGRAVRKHQSAIAARRSDPSPRVREAAMSALNQLRSAWSDLAETSEMFRQGPLSPGAATAVIDMAIAGDLDPLVRTLGSEDSKKVVAKAVFERGADKLPSLLSAAKAAPVQDQNQIIAALADSLRQGLPTQPLLAQLKALDSDVRLMAVEIAGKIGTPVAINGVIEVLERDPVADVRSRAAALLSGTPGKAAHDALQRAQRDDPNSVVRRVAGRALEQGSHTPSDGVLLSPPEGETAEDDASEVA